MVSDIAYSPLTRASAPIASLAPQDVRRRMEETLRANASRPLFTGISVSLISQGRETLLKISRKRPQKCFHMCTLHPLWCKVARFHNSVPSTYFQWGLPDMTTRSAITALINFICSPMSRNTRKSLFLLPKLFHPGKLSVSFLSLNSMH